MTSRQSRAVEAIVLAAGLGTRMGRIKPLVPIDGTPSLTHVLHRLADAGLTQVIVVLGHGSDEIRQRIDLSRARIEINENPSRGMASSLAIGLRAVSADVAGALILHADMPFVSAATLRAVAEAAADGARIAAPRFRGRRGFPVYFAKACFPELIEGLRGETGGREYIEAHREDLILIDVEDEGILLDIDRPEDIPVQMGRIASRS